MKFIVAAILMIGVQILIGCSANKADVQRVLEGEGCTETTVGGWTLFGCSDKDVFSNTFTCTKNGKRVAGVVCSGWFKAYTIRYM